MVSDDDWAETTQPNDSDNRMDSRCATAPLGFDRNHDRGVFGDVCKCIKTL
jgi:hypothetical protein